MSFFLNNVLFVLDHGQLDCKLRALAEVALYRDVALVQDDDLLDVSQTEAKALDVMHIACVYAVELLKHLLKVVALNAQACVADGEIKMRVIVPCAYVDVDRLVGFAIFYCIVEQVVNDILEVHLIDIDR